MRHLKRLREAEFQMIKHWFVPRSSVLEIGGASGFQAKLISGTGCDVKSIDIAARPQQSEIFYPVKIYDGKNIPFLDSSFDVIYSSNVLEHISLRDLPYLFREMKRVLKADGLVIHILPTPAWRIWTLISYYPKVVLSFYKILVNYVSGQVLTPISEEIPPVGKSSMLRILSRCVPEPHGVSPNVLAEICDYRMGRWTHVFETNGFRMLDTMTNGIFYTGHELFPCLPLCIRKLMSRFMGSACRVYVMRPKDT